jgi:riboflavin biosynthesis pyrimidine reductase/predicted DsbA family dithiol-disulfide isomerase
MPQTIPVAHDFVCEWSWIALFQLKRLKHEFDIEIDWKGYELWPEGLEREPCKPRQFHPDRPKTPTRFELAVAAEGLVFPEVDRPTDILTHNAHEAVEFAKEEGVADELVERIYHAYWSHGLDISNPAVLAMLAKGLIEDISGMLGAIHDKKYRDHIIPFDDPARHTGVHSTPTLWIGGERYSQQPYRVLRQALGATEDPAAMGIYESLVFPPAPEDRPYIFINMVSTIDGKTVSGSKREHVADLGSKVDHIVMRRLERAAQGVMIGGGTLRSTPNLWYPGNLFRIVVTRSGEISFYSRFFTEAPKKAIVACPGNADFKVLNARVIRTGEDEVDLREVLRILREEYGISYLAVEGGSELNADLLAEDLIDELFLTVSPKVKLGRDVPTYAGGEPLPREEIQQYALIEQHRVDDEIFLRYRRKP